MFLSSPEYVRAIPGGLKNSIDWLVSRNEIMGKPVSLVHASHRGDDIHSSLRMVLATVSDRFSEDIFLRVPLSSTSQEEAELELSREQNVTAMIYYLEQLRSFVEDKT